MSVRPPWNIAGRALLVKNSATQMTRNILLSIGFILTIAVPTTLTSWGFWAHREIVRNAVVSLPGSMKVFFEQWDDTLIAWSVYPDVRRSWDPSEDSKHYINLDRYGRPGERNVPLEREDAIRNFGRVAVDSFGTLPWVIGESVQKLAQAMTERNGRAILTFSADLAHYVSDAHVPLHSTSNYDGQRTGQRGIHSRWESRIPERYGSTYSLGPGTVEAIHVPVARAFEILTEGESLVDSVLSLDIQSRKGIPESEVYQWRERSGRRYQDLTPKAIDAYHTLIGPMVQRQLNASISAVASYWFTAWLKAGKPDLAAISVTW